MTKRSVGGRHWRGGQSGKQIWIAESWRVLDVGSGHMPHDRANILLEKYAVDDAQRAGATISPDSRLVLGDAHAMPFSESVFDYVIASHIAEHVDDPIVFCRELERVARSGYIETPGPLADILLREPFHRWRVRRRGARLEFEYVRNARPLGRAGDAVYALFYLGQERVGHPTIVFRRPIGRLIAALVRYSLAGLVRLPVLRRFWFTEFEWSGNINLVVAKWGSVTRDYS